MHNSDDFSAFAEHARAIAERFEKRRRYFLKQLKLRSALAMLVLATLPWWYGWLEHIDDMNGSAVSSLAWVIMHILAAAIIVGGVIAYAAMPLFRYRYSVVQIGRTLPGVSGVGQQAVSLKSEIYGQLFSYFGKFALYSDRKLALRSLRGAPNLPAFDEFLSEDYIKGSLQGVSVEMTEAKLIAHQQQEQAQSLFSGFLIVLDINDTALVLRGKFAGNTVVIADLKDANGYLATQYDQYQAARMPDASFEAHFKAFTTNKEEAARLLSPALLRNILKLSETLRVAGRQNRHIDDRLAFAISNIARLLSDVMATVAKGLVQWFKTGRFRLASKRHMLNAEDAPVTENALAFNQSVQCAFYQDKVLVSIPCRQNFFEPDPIFSPPLNADDIKLAYDMMTMVDELSQAVVGSLPKEMV